MRQVRDIAGKETAKSQTIDSLSPGDIIVEYAIILIIQAAL